MTEAIRSVRLECVMHAASVNPEPGSNSLKNRIFSHSRELIPFSELFILASYYLYFFQSVLTRSLHFSVLEISCCSIFKERFSHAFRSALNYYTSFFSFCQVFFKEILNFFDIFYTCSSKIKTHKKGAFA